MSDTGGPPATEGPGSDDNRLIAERRAKLASLRAAGPPFPNDFRRDALAAVLQKQFADLDKAALEERNAVFSVAGRLVANRGAFLLIQDGSGRIQLYVDRKGLPAETLEAIRAWDLGDIVAATGPLQRSGKGDLYISMHSARLLTKSLRPLPDKYHGLADQELRYRRRYVDLIVNDEARERFRLRSRIVSAIRDYMNRHHFLEVETPMMHPVAGGAAARPFVTHHNALDLEMYLRIAPELYLKRLVVGGFERVYEINRNFRNEGVSTRHNPEFTMLEFYWAFADYRDAMEFTEKLIRELAITVLGTTELTWQGVRCELGDPFRRLDLLSAVQQHNPTVDPVAFTELESCRVVAEAAAIVVDPRWGLGKLQLELFEKTVEPQLLQPTFITDYPTEVSPLARRSDDNPAVAERFELFLGGRELANGFSELNDPEDQAERFRSQVEDKAAGDQEAMEFDEDYIRALEYGLPPTAGVGVGIDRLVMALTDSASIRDVLLFPHLRPESHGA